MADTFYPGVSGDDGWWGTGYELTDDNQVALGNYSGSLHFFVRFPSVNIPQGANITSAVLTLQSYNSESATTVNVRCSFNDVDNAVAPVNKTEAEALVLTTAYVDWSNIGAWSINTDYNSPDLASVLQEVIDRVGWSSGNALQIVVRDNSSTGNTSRYGKSRNLSATLCARLIVDYTSTTEIAASIPISPTISGTLMKGLPGDIWNANLEISPQLSATIHVATTLFASITPSISLSGTIEVAAVPELAGTIIVAPQISGTISFSPVGVASFTLPSLDLSATGVGENLGYTYSTLPIILLSADGFDSCLGDGVITLPELAVLIAGDISEIGEATQNLPSLSLLATGSADILGNGDITLPRLILVSEPVIGELGNLSVTLPVLQLSGVGIDGAVGEGSITIPFFTLSASGVLDASGTAILTLPSLTLLSEIAPSVYLNLVMNLRNRALTLYSNYNFNSFCRFNEKHLGATSTGIFDLDKGNTDNGDLIKWNLRTGYLDLEQKVKKRLQQAWLSYKSNGDLIVTVVLPDGTEYEYNLTGYEVTEEGIRVKFGRGIKSKYVALDIRNVGGSSITLDTLRLHLEKIGAVR